MNQSIFIKTSATSSEPLRPQTGWTFPSIAAVVLLLCATAALAVCGVREAINLLKPATAADTTAGLVVFATDGDQVSVWLDRDGQPGRALPLATQLPAGKVALRVTRRVGNDKYRSDIIRLELRPGMQHLVTVGDTPISGNAFDRSNRHEFVSHFLAPGPLAFDDQKQTLDVTEAQTIAHPLEPNHPVYFDDDSGSITTSDHALLLVNPYSDIIECEVSTDHWSHEISLPGPICHVVAVGSAAHVHVTTRLAPGNQPIDDDDIDLPDGLALYTVGGRTLYRWTTADSSTPPPTLAAPKGLVASLPASASVTLSSDPQSDHCILTVDQGQGASARLSIVGSVAILPPHPQPLGDLTIHPQVQLSEISVPNLEPDAPVTAIATDGSSLLGVSDSTACDLSTGKPLHQKSDFGVARLAIGKFGLVLLTDDGALAAIQDGKLVRGPTVDRPNPTTHIVPVPGDDPVVWLFRADQPQLLLHRLDSQTSESLTIGATAATTEPSEDNSAPAIGITALTAIDANNLLVARDRRIDRLTHDDVSGTWLVHPIVILPPADDEPIIGVVESAGRLIFSTRRSVFTLQGDTVLPLVDGLGGPLFNWHEGILVHDSRSLRIFQLSGPGQQQADTQSEASP